MRVNNLRAILKRALEVSFTDEAGLSDGEYLKARLDASPEAVQADPVYSTGQRVRIVDGVLEGIEGLFEGSAQQRTCALLEIMGRRVKVPMKSIIAA